MRAVDLPLLNSVSSPTLHPDGGRVIVAVSHPDLEADRTVGQLWSVNTDGSGCRRITRGTADSSPLFSPDGLLLAFVRAVDGSGQLHVMDSAGGEPMVLTDQKLGITGFRWSPDSSSIAFTAAVAEEGRYGTVTGLSDVAEPPRRITTLNFLANGIGFTTDRRVHVFLVAVPSPGTEPTYPEAPSVENPTPVHRTGVPVARRLTFGDFDHGSISFAPNGESIAVVSSRASDRDLTLVSDVYALDLSKELPQPESLTAGDLNLSVSMVSYAPTGELYLIASDLGDRGLDFVGHGGQLWVLDAPRTMPRLLTDPETVDLHDSITVVAGGALVETTSRGRVTLLRVDRDGTLTPLTDDETEVSGSAAAANTVVVTFTAAGSAGDVGLIESDGLVQLTDFSLALRETGVVALDEVTIAGRDGYPVHGWTLTPAGEGPHPVLLVIHGGPFAQWSISFFDEAQVYAQAGYAVVMCNPRGAAGYGVEHARAIRHRMGTVDFDDVIDFLDGAIAEHDDFDGSRVGIMGGSYGGYLTAWTIAHDHRFTGAIVERGFLDPDGFVGTSDIGSFFGDEYTGTDPEQLQAQSPQAVVGQVTTPTLVIHSSDDLRCPLPQGERYYAALKRNGVSTELLIFPGENHELSRSGRPRHRLQRFDAVLEWWSRYLPTAENPAQTTLAS